MIYLIKYWKPLVAILLAIFLYGYGYLHGMNDTQAEWDKARTAMLERNLKINTEISSGYIKNINDLRKRYDAIRMRPESDLRLSNCANGADAETRTDGLHGNLSAPWLLMYQADLQTQQLISLQDWIHNVTK